MRIDPQSLTAAEMYRFMISAIVPRPIAWVSTRAADGGTNLAPFSYFTALSSAPPLVGIAINDREGDPKDTLRNIRETGEWVVNVVTEALVPAMVRTAGEWPRGVSEFAKAGLTESPAERVRAPGVLESPIRLECRLHREIALGNSVLVVGEVLVAHVDDRVVVDGRVVAERLAAVGRLGGEYYAPLREVVKVPRPRVSRTSGELPAGEAGPMARAGRTMNTMFDEQARAGMLARLDRLAPSSPRRWGRMTAPQMVWHLAAQLRGVLGELEVKQVDVPFLRSAFFHWLIIDSPLPWPRGKVQTAPEYAAFAPGEWAADVARLKELLERLASRGESACVYEHPAFGRLDGRKAGRLIWRHWNHHLTQFGV